MKRPSLSEVLVFLVFAAAGLAWLNPLALLEQGRYIDAGVNVAFGVMIGLACFGWFLTLIDASRRPLRERTVLYALIAWVAGSLMIAFWLDAIPADAAWWHLASPLAALVGYGYALYLMRKWVITRGDRSLIPDGAQGPSYRDASEVIPPQDDCRAYVSAPNQRGLPRVVVGPSEQLRSPLPGFDPRVDQDPHA